MKYSRLSSAFFLALALALGRVGAAEADSRFNAYEARSITAASGARMPYRLYRPAGRAKASLPLLLMLHSISERGNDNLKPYKFFQPHLSEDFYTRHPCVIVMPQCPHGKYWWELAPMECLDAIIPALLAELPEIDPSRIYVTGVSLGGYATYAVLADNPGLFAAAIPICGDPRPTPLRAESLADFPIWIFHGAKDSRVSVKGDRALMSKLKVVDKNARYTEYPDEGHRIWKRTYAQEELWDWLFEQKRP
jgi:predicted peptidase